MIGHENNKILIYDVWTVELLFFMLTPSPPLLYHLRRDTYHQHPFHTILQNPGNMDLIWKMYPMMVLKCLLKSVLLNLNTDCSPDYSGPNC